MHFVFLHAPLASNHILGLVLGEEPAPLSKDAELPGYAVRQIAGGLHPALLPEPGGRAPGLLLGLDLEQLARLDFCMTAFDAARQACDLSSSEVVDAYITACDRAGSSSDAAESSLLSALTFEMVGEVMGHFGKRRVEEMNWLARGIAFRALARVRGARMLVPVRLRAGLSSEDVQTVRHEFPYANHFGIEEFTLRHRRFDGSLTPLLTRAVFTSGDAVTILPFDPVRGAVLLIEQFRPGALARRDPNPWFLEAVAGRCDALEEPEQAARREALEETGIEIGRMERIAGYYPSPGVMSEYITAFVGEADLEKAGGVHGLDAEHEDIRTLIVPLSEATALFSGGEANNAPLMISLLWLERHHRRLASAWRPLDGSASSV